jgi:hypothetical protein
VGWSSNHWRRHSSKNAKRCICSASFMHQLQAVFFFSRYQFGYTSNQTGHIDSELECDTLSPCSNTSNHSSKDTRLYLGPSGSLQSLDENKMRLNDVSLTSPESSSTARDSKRRWQHHASNCSKQAFQAPLSFWPRWAYEMYGSYTLARRAAGREMLLFHQSYFTFPQFDDIIFPVILKLNPNNLRFVWNI